ncbi:hypothetical protein Goshw_014335 [Gossypium schwendimanii]|uniref:RNase H type-1 domain-containing protein n=1 Tax=Gossypium schwendimanii TaxID=34291 RepID=A0A7J9N0J8_GOSSC|nr:hypothetical protein [Gossypium schwendimanii]
MTATAGVIIRNHEGFVMGACTYPLGRTGDLTTAEANVYLQAAIFGEEMGFRDLVVEGDALIVIKKLKSDSVDRSHIPLQLEDSTWLTHHIGLKNYQRRLNLSSSTTKEDFRIGRNRSFLSESKDATQKRLSSPPSDDLRFRRNLVERFNEIFYSDEKAQPVNSTTTTIDAKKRKCDFLQCWRFGKKTLFVFEGDIVIVLRTITLEDVALQLKLSIDSGYTITDSSITRAPLTMTSLFETGVEAAVIAVLRNSLIITTIAVMTRVSAFSPQSQSFLSLKVFLRPTLSQVMDNEVKDTTFGADEEK